MPGIYICIDVPAHPATATLLWDKGAQASSSSPWVPHGTSSLYFHMLPDLWLNSDGPLIPDSLFPDGAEPTQEEPSAILSVGVAMTWQDAQMSSWAFCELDNLI